MIIKQKSCDVVEICDQCEISFTSSEEHISHCKNAHNEEGGMVEEISEVSTEYTINEFPEQTVETDR